MDYTERMDRREERTARRGNVDRARALRRDMTGPERHLWQHLRSRQLDGLKFRRQYPLGPFVLDFYCAEASLAVEVDGESHVGCGEADAARDRWLREQGVRVIRVTNDDVLRETEAVLLFILRSAREE